MKSLLLPAALSLLATGVCADPTHLAGGAFITHYEAELLLSEPPPEGMCALYEAYAITSAEEQVNRIDAPTAKLATWFIIAAWLEEKEFCGWQLGFNDYDPALFNFTWYDPCFPPTGGLCIPSGYFPHPNQGTACVVTGDPWFGNYLPIYWFIGYAYGYGDPGIIQIVPDPTVTVPFAGTANCMSPPETYEAHLGGMGINTDGVYVEPTTALGVCCFGEDLHECTITGEDQCLQIGGEFHLEWDSCGPNPCVVVSGNAGVTWGVIKDLYR